MRLFLQFHTDTHKHKKKWQCPKAEAVLSVASVSWMLSRIPLQLASLTTYVSTLDCQRAMSGCTIKIYILPIRPCPSVSFHNRPGPVRQNLRYKHFFCQDRILRRGMKLKLNIIYDQIDCKLLRNFTAVIIFWGHNLSRCCRWKYEIRNHVDISENNKTTYIHLCSSIKTNFTILAYTAVGFSISDKFLPGLLCIQKNSGLKSFLYPVTGETHYPAKLQVTFWQWEKSFTRVLHRKFIYYTNSN